MPAPTRRASAPRASVLTRASILSSLALLGALGLALLAPRLADGYTALQWTRHYAQGLGRESPHERLRQCGRQAARAIDRLAPLPQAARAARLALDLARELRAERSVEARALRVVVHEALARQRASAWRGMGLAALGDEARDEARE